MVTVRDPDPALGSMNLWRWAGQPADEADGRLLRPAACRHDVGYPECPDRYRLQYRRWPQQPLSVSPEKQPDLAQAIPQKTAEKPCRPLSNAQELEGLPSASRHPG